MLRWVVVLGFVLSLTGCAGLASRWDGDYIYDPVDCALSGIFCGMPRHDR